jgi:hypothetical protein
MIAEIETTESVSEGEASQWLQYSNVQPFFLYVPRGSGQKARTLARGIPVSGFREYANVEGRATIVNLN